MSTLGREVASSKLSPSNKELETIASKLLRRLQDEVDHGGQEGRWASEIVADVFQEVCGGDRRD